MQLTLKQILNEGGEALNNLLNRMQKFNANIEGSNAYFFKRRNKLEALMEQEGICAAQFILSAADNHWIDLNKIIHGDRPMPNFNNGLGKAKWR